MKFRLPKKRRYRFCLYFLSTLLILFAIDLIWVRIWRRIAVSPETTFITAPLNADGKPDYLRYLDDQTRQGVTAENNAAIPFFQAVTPTRTDGTPPQAHIITGYYERLGIAPPERIRPAVRFGDFLRSKKPPVEETKDRSDEEELIRTRPWAAAEHPDAAAWIESQQELLAALPAITSRTQWYVPKIPSQNGLLISVLIPYVSDMRQLAGLAMTRAMAEIHDGRFAEAQADILACHRLARLSARGWTVIEYLVGLVIEKMALEADITFATAPGLSSVQLHQFIDNLQSLSRWPATVPASFDTERLANLDTLVWLAAHPQETQAITSMNRQTNAEALNNVSMALRPAHFNAAMCEANLIFDQMDKALHAPTIRERMALTTQFDDRLHAYATAHGGYLGDPARQIISLLVPLFSNAINSHDVHEVNMSLTNIALAAIAFHSDTGAFPEALAALSPKYLAEIPADAFSEKPLHYRKTSDGFLLYSVGPNQVDDGGERTEPANPSTPQKPDDIAIRVPPVIK